MGIRVQTEIMRRNQNRKPPVNDRIVRRENSSDETVMLMDFVARMMPDHGRSDIKKWLKYGHILVNGNPSSAFNTPVNPGDMVELNLIRPFVTFSHPRLKLVYEDDDILIVEKGYGLLSVGTGKSSASKSGKEVTAYNILKDYVKKQNPMNKVFVVHRLDRDTSGLMMFAKNMDAQTSMQHNWNNMVISRKYVALVEGVMREQTGVVKSNLEENSSFSVYSSNEGGKPALTRYKVLQRGKRHTLVEFELETGRKNQIRVHASDMGHPIVGDRKYGGHSSPIHRLALHARTLRFAHPITKQYMEFESPVPPKFIGLLRHS